MAKVILKPIYNTPVEEIPIHTEFIRLDAFLKFCNLTESGGLAKQLIQEGEVRVNGLVCLQRGKKLRPGDTVTLTGRSVRVTEETAPCT